MPNQNSLTSTEGYSETIRKMLSKKGINVGDRISVNGKNEGILMPRISGDRDILILKLDNGYNIGIKPDLVKKISGVTKTKDKAWLIDKKHDPSKPTIVILHTGGTIASKLDYRTGAVNPAITDDELLAMYPELSEIANIQSRIVFQMFSEDMETAHWSAIAKKIESEISAGCDGVIVTHGTDTMYYTASAMSFALQNLPIPVIFVASQRSSDRPSSDAGINLMSAALFIAQGDFAGVGTCMHSSPSDEKCFILEANRCRKMHTSRRDTYRPINFKPLAEVEWEARTVKFLRGDYNKKDRKKKLQLKAKFSDKVGFLKIYPGFPQELVDVFSKKYEGLVLEGYAFGQLPINSLDKATEHHSKLLEKLSILAKKIPVIIVSQVPYGVMNMNVYSTSRDIVNAGVIPAYMQSYSAYVKLCWLLGNGIQLKEIREEFNKDLAGEVFSRQEVDEFPDNAMER